MRCPLPPLLALLAAAAAATAAQSPGPPPALLVLSAACRPSRPELFAERTLRRYAADTGRAQLVARSLRVLSYRETCEARSGETVTRNVLAQLSAGGAALGVGWPGAAACGAWAAAARALRQPQPESCAAGEARGAAVAELASRLHWRRALLPALPAGDSCAANTGSVERALQARGLAVRHDLLVPDASLLPHVVILCSSRHYMRGVHGYLARLGAGGGGGGGMRLAVLLLQADEQRGHSDDGTLPKSDAVESGPNPRGQLAKIDESTKRVASSTSHRGLSKPVSSGVEVETSSSPDVEAFLLRLGETFTPLLLTDLRFETGRVDSETEIVYEEALQAINREAESNRTGTETSRLRFALLERARHLDAGKWNRVVTIETTLRHSLGELGDRPSDVQFSNASVHFDSWCETNAAVGERARDAVSGAFVSMAGAALAMLVLAVLALLLRWLRSRRRRRRREDVVLALGDFSFPPDEQRRVGEGMETMLSCWLQQLHEFGGPELERPDLLKQPVPPVPSAPSSTCSINRTSADRRPKYKGDAVHLKYLPTAGALELKRKTTDVLLIMQGLRHENLNPFIGCLCEARPALVWDHCGRGSLEDVLVADEIKLDWTFRLSLLTDLVRGMRYLHASPLRVHGRLSSRNCVVDSRWVLRLTDYGLPGFYRAQGLPQPARSARELLWTAPELLRETPGAGRSSQPGDVFSFAIIMQEVIVRGEPYCMLALTPDEIVEKVRRPPPLIRPSVSMGAAPPEAVSVMRQCWAEAPELRPDFDRLHDIFRHLHRGRKINIVDSMFEMLEKYSNNLEELIKERTEQLDMEKKKTEQLLNRMLPRSVAELLLRGARVEPEEFEEVTVYFSDIVGFTALAARSSPVQVVDLLNDLYTTFDAAIERYRVYKVETIGDAYMVVGGLPARCASHAQAVATMALHLLHLAGRFRIRHLPGTPLHLRSGVHTGPCCAGVVGLTMPRYCLFGDTVNTASRMESTGAAWRVQLSAATAERLAATGGFRLRSRGLVHVKGKGAMHTYWLLGKDGFDKPLPTPPPLESEEVLFETDGENESESFPPGDPAVPQPVERQRSEPSPARDRYAWHRSGAVSADSSPPRNAPAPPAPLDHSAAYARYRCAGGARVLRRQWSLERGDALAEAAGTRNGGGGGDGADAAGSLLESLALQTAAGGGGAERAGRYRTRAPREAAGGALPPDPTPPS